MGETESRSTAWIIAMTKRLCEAPGTSGREDGAAAVAEELLAPLGTVTRNPLGSVLCCVNEGERGAPHLMLEAHLDQIGMGPRPGGQGHREQRRPRPPPGKGRCPPGYPPSSAASP